MVKKNAPKLSPFVSRPLDVMAGDLSSGKMKPLQIRIAPQLHREIKITATEQGKSITAFLLDCYDFWRRMNK